MRVAKAQDDLWKLSENLETEEDIKNLEISVRNKYDIPDSVYLFQDQEQNKLFLPQAKKHISAFVKGQLDNSTFRDLYFFFEEYNECDYSWILIEKPSHFYAQDGVECNIKELLVELKAVGCRSKVKNKKLPVLAPLFSGFPRKSYEKVAQEVGWELEAI